MRRQRQRPPHPSRVAATSGLLGALAGGLLAAATALPRTVVGQALSVIAGALLAPVIASPLEWLVHRYVYHRPAPLLGRIYEVHHRAHHRLFFPTWRYVTGGPVRRIPIFGGDHSRAHTTAWGNALTRLAHSGFYLTIGLSTICLAAWLVTRNAAFVAGSFAACAVVSNLMVTVHDTIHRPGSHRLVEGQPWFRWLDRHHYVHHVDTEANGNFLMRLADALFGTLRSSLTEEERARLGSQAGAAFRMSGTPRSRTS